MSLESLLDEDSISVEQQVVVQDTSGGPTRTWTTLYTGVPARVTDPTAQEKLQYLMLGTEAPHKIIHQQAGIGEGIRIRTSDGRLIKVHGTRKIRQEGGIDTYYQTMGTEWRPGT